MWVLRPSLGTFVPGQSYMLAQRLAESLHSEHWPPIHLRAAKPLNRWVWLPHRLGRTPANWQISALLDSRRTKHFASFACWVLWRSCNLSERRYKQCRAHSLPNFILSSPSLPFLSPSFHPLIVSLFSQLRSGPKLLFFPHEFVSSACFSGRKV